MRNFDVARDGRILVVWNPEAELRIDHASVMLNFDQEVRRRFVPAKP